MLEILFDILFCLVMFFSFVSISASFFGENEKGEKIIRALDFIMLILMSVYIIKSLNSFNPDKLAIFVLAAIFTLILLVKNIFSLVCFIKAKRKERRELIENNFGLISKLVFIPRCDENGNVIFGKTRLLTNFALERQRAVEEEMRKKELEALLEVRRIGAEFHNPEGVAICFEQRPNNWEPERPRLFFDNSFSIPNEEKLPRWYNPEAESVCIVFDCINMRMGKKLISNCFCGGKGELVKYTKCEGKDAYPMSYIVCNSCGIQTKEFCAEEDDLVIERWNSCMQKA